MYVHMSVCPPPPPPIDDSDGDRAGCGVLGATTLLWLASPPTATVLGAYPGYGGALLGTAAGAVVVQDVADAGTLTLTFSLTGMAAGTTAGLHIHSGSSCAETTSPGGHYWESSVVPDDPWSTTYTSDGGGAAAGSFSVVTGRLEERTRRGPGPKWPLG